MRLGFPHRKSDGNPKNHQESSFVVAIAIWLMESHGDISWICCECLGHFGWCWWKDLGCISTGKDTLGMMPSGRMVVECCGFLEETPPTATSWCRDSLKTQLWPSKRIQKAQDNGVHMSSLLYHLNHLRRQYYRDSYVCWHMLIQ